MHTGQATICCPSKGLTQVVVKQRARRVECPLVLEALSALDFDPRLAISSAHPSERGVARVERPAADVAGFTMPFRAMGGAPRTDNRCRSPSKFNSVLSQEDAATVPNLGRAITDARDRREGHHAALGGTGRAKYG